jgi:uncharacterized Zn finger protein (UPF0148 family)
MTNVFTRLLLQTRRKEPDMRFERTEEHCPHGGQSGFLIDGKMRCSDCGREIFESSETSSSENQRPAILRGQVEAVENDRLAKLEADASSLASLFVDKVPRLEARWTRLDAAVEMLSRTLAKLEKEVSRLAAKVDAPKAENPRRMKSNPRCNPDSHEESKHIGEHDKLPSCDNDPKCVPVEPEPPSGEPSYPWDSAPEGTVAAAYESDTIPIWFFCRVADEGFHFRTIRIRNGASLNGCAWEKSLRVNPKFKGGK